MRRCVAVLVALAAVLGLPAAADAGVAAPPAPTAAAPAAQPTGAVSPPFELAWEHDLAEEMDLVYQATFAVGDVLVLLGTYNRQGYEGDARVIGIEGRTGEVLWERTVPGIIWHRGAAVAGDSLLVPQSFSAGDGEFVTEQHAGLVSIEARTGEIDWQVETPGTYGGHLVVDPTGTTAVLTTFEVMSDEHRTHTGDREVLATFDVATGAPRWEAELDRAPDLSHLYHSANGLLVDGTTAYAGSRGHLRAFDLLTGVVRWSIEVEADDLWRGVAPGYLVGNRIVVHSSGSTVAYDALTGVLLGPATGMWLRAGDLGLMDASDDGSGLVQAVDLNTGRRRWTARVWDSIDAVAGDLFFAHTGDGAIDVGDVATGRRLGGLPSGLWSTVFDVDLAGGSLVVSGFATIHGFRPVAGSVTQVTPSATTAGAPHALRLSGSGFVGATAVRIGDHEVDELTQVSDEEIELMVPALAPGTYPVRVIDADGETWPQGSRARLEVLAPPDAPALSPAVGRPLGGTTISIAVDDAHQVDAVRFGPVPVPITARVDRHLEVSAPPGAGTVGVEVHTLAGWSPPTAFSYAGTPVAVDPSATLDVDASHDNANDSPLELPLVERWRLPLPGAAAASYPVIAEGKVFVAEVGRVRAVDAASGFPIWGPIALQATSVSYGDGRLYVAARNRVYALDPETGSTIWVGADDRRLTYETFDIPPVTPAGNHVVIGVGHSIASLDARTGELEWAAEANAWTSVAVADGVAVAQTDSGSVRAFDLETGAVRWARTSGGSGAGGQPPVQIAAGRVHTPDELPGTLGCDCGGVYDLQTGADLGFVRGPHDRRSTVVAADQVVLHGTPDGAHTGPTAVSFPGAEQRWHVPTAELRNAVSDGRHVFATDIAGVTRAVDLRTGAVDWSHDADGDAEPVSHRFVRRDIFPGAALGDGLLVTEVGDELVAYGSTTTVAAVEPRLALPGGEVTITGDHLDGATQVTFGGVPASSFRVVDGSTVAAVPPFVPTRAVDVRVTTPAGTSPISPGDRYGLLGTGVLNGIGPLLDRVVGGALQLGALPALVSVVGSGFAEGATLSADGLVVTDVVRVGPGLLTALVSAPTGTVLGPRDLVVQNPDGGTASSVGALTVGPPPGSLTTVGPSRLLDTRVAGGGGCVGPGATRAVRVTGRDGIPAATQVGAVVLNVTATGPTAAGWLTVHPSGSAPPPTSSLNFLPGQSVPNLVLAKVGADGTVAVRNSTGCTHVVVDVVGWTAAGAAPAGGGFQGLAPARLLDTRADGQRPCLGSAQIRELTVTGTGGVPSDGVAAVALNVTATGPTAAGWLTAWPAASAVPLASNLNFSPGQTVANAVVVRVGAGGKVAIGNAHGCTDVVVDVVGWYSAAGAGPPHPPGAFVPLAPGRVLDTRSQGGCIAGTPRPLRVTGQRGVPASGVGAVLVNVTATGATASSWLTVYAGGQPPPATSNLNFEAGASVPNLVVAPVGPDGTIRLQNAKGCAHAVVDVAGWFAAAP